MKFRMFLVPCLLAGLVACGKGDKGGGASGGGGGGEGPACSVAAAAYVDAHVKGGGNKIAALKPTPEEIKVLNAAFEADCTSRPWSGDEKTCVVGIKSLLTDDKCFKGLMVAQMVHDSAGAIKTAREGAPK